MRVSVGQGTRFMTSLRWGRKFRLHMVLMIC